MNASIDDLLNRLDTLPFHEAHSLVLHVLDRNPRMMDDPRLTKWVSRNSRAILDVVKKRVEKYEQSQRVASVAQDHIVDDLLTAAGKAVPSLARSAPQTRYNPTRNHRHPDTCSCPACRPFIYPRR
jgi:hypothetical protein